MKTSWIIIGLAMGIILAGNNSCSNAKTKSLNPNGDSELALLMREMYEDGMRTKQQLLDGKQPEVKVKYKQLHTAKATEPEKVANPSYAAFAKTYEAAMDSFLFGDAGKKVEYYHSMVTSCMNCHSQFCPGPKMKIKKMYLSEKEMSSLSASGD